jgi:hypothetical protein
MIPTAKPAILHQKRASSGVEALPIKKAKSPQHPTDRLKNDHNLCSFVLLNLSTRK